jgi:hypothetical protein
MITQDSTGEAGAGALGGGGGGAQLAARSEAVATAAIRPDMPRR